jgi:hypothetical protein
MPVRGVKNAHNGSMAKKHKGDYNHSGAVISRFSGVINQQPKVNVSTHFHKSVIKLTHNGAALRQMMISNLYNRANHGETYSGRRR